MEGGFFSRWKKDRKVKQKSNELRREIYKLEQEYEVFKVESNLSANPVSQIVKLVLGCFYMILSFCFLI